MKQSFKLMGLESNAQLALVPAAKPGRLPRARPAGHKMAATDPCVLLAVTSLPPVRVALQLENNTRYELMVPAKASLWDSLVMIGAQLSGLQARVLTCRVVAGAAHNVDFVNQSKPVSDVKGSHS